MTFGRRLVPVAVTVLALTAGMAGCLRDIAVQDGPTWFGFGSDNLHQEEPVEGRAEVRWSWSDYAAGAPPPMWRTGAFDSPATVTRADLNVTFVFDQAASLQLPVRPFSRPPLTAWFGVTGATDSIISHEFAAGPQVAGGGQVAVHWPITLPPGGLHVPAGASLAVWLGSYYLSDGGVSIDLGASRLDVVMEPSLGLDGPATTSQSGQASVMGGACVVRDPTGGPLDEALLDAAMERVAFEVPAGSVGVEVDVRASFGDVDFALYGPDGGEVVHALGPSNPERVLLGRDNLAAVGPGQWTLLVYACSVGTGDVDFTIRQWLEA